MVFWYPPMLHSMPRTVLRWVALCTGLSLVVGAGAAGFVHTLDWVLALFQAHPLLLFTLPALGLAMTWLYANPAKAAQGGLRTLLAQIRSPSEPLPSALAPAIVGTTLLSHLGELPSAEKAPPCRWEGVWPTFWDVLGGLG